ncbi:nuclear transport factor 2 family protein, partial [uncultured Oscillibacter sp.]|uniref:nuclear transport factor 2 family protein n=2 Tax=uncultured Oscillibacter sp. TaxID=876091 RepID=UPI002639EBD6
REHRSVPETLTKEDVLMMSKEVEQVREVIQRYITGTYQADVEMLAGVFHPQAHMTGYLGDNLLLGTPEPFLQDIGSAPSMASKGDPYHAEIRELTVTGHIATVVLYETGFRGEGVLEDHFQLLLDGGKWSIISKNFTTL